MRSAVSGLFGAALPVAAIAGLVLSCSSAEKGPSGPPRPWERIPKEPGLLAMRFGSLGTEFSIRAWSGNLPPDTAKNVVREAANEIKRISAMCDPLVEGSDVQKINAAAGKEWVKVHPEVMEMIAYGQAMWKRSEGAFNISYRKGVAPESKFGLDLEVNLPSQAIKLSTIITELNLYGLARGYAADRAMAKLAGKGLAGYMITAQGFVEASGKPLHMPNAICIEDPKQLGSCTQFLKITRDPFIFGVSASEERRGNLYHPNELWKYRSGGVAVTGESGPWVQFATTISAVMTDGELGALFKGTPPLRGYFRAEDGMMAGGLEPYASIAITPPR